MNKLEMAAAIYMKRLAPISVRETEVDVHITFVDCYTIVVAKDRWEAACLEHCN